MQFSEYDFIDSKSFSGKIILTSFPGLNTEGIFEEDILNSELELFKNNNCSWESCVQECVNCKENCPWIQKQFENIVQYYEPPKKNNLGA